MNYKSEREQKHGALARKIAGESIVLLKNAHMLPLNKETKLALLGNGAGKTVKGGTGSGDVNNRKSITIFEGFTERMAEITSRDWILDYDKRYECARQRWRDNILEDAKKVENPFDAYASNPFVYPDGREVTESDIVGAEAAVYVVSRICGEGKERRLEKGDYYLSEKEEQDLNFLCSHLPVVLILNAGGVIELTDLLERQPNIRAVLQISELGQEGGRAVCDILYGDINPSGKLTVTWPRKYEDIPFANEFSYLNGNLDYDEYREDIYVGYRYFTTFQVKPLFPFGYGLSYTTFDVEEVMLDVSQKVTMTVRVTNTGNCAGKEVVQAYVTLPSGKLNKEKLRLVGFEKTNLLEQGEQQHITFEIDARQLASFDETRQAFIIEEGSYTLCIGTNCEELKACYRFRVNETTAIESVHKICPLRGELNVLGNGSEIAEEYETEEEEVTACFTPHEMSEALKLEQACKTQTDTEDRAQKQAGQVTDIAADDLLRTLFGNITEGASNLGSSGKRVPGSAGETTEWLEQKYGYPSLIMADGPAGLRLRQSYETDRDSGEVYGVGVFGSLENGYLEPMKLHENGEIHNQYCTAFPVGTALAQTFNRELMEQFGEAVGTEMQEFGVDLWLAPGLNIQRNPLCGRNFEYYSEDPFVAGIVAASVTKGVQKREGCGVTIKHFACNNQEDNRMSVDARVTQRALREIYLRGFEIAVKTARPVAVMTSYNLLNSVHTANSYDLCTTVLREEWGFDGLVMSDWNTTVPEDGSIPYQCCMAGNDIIMPGNPNDFKNIREAYEQGLLTEECIRKSAGRLIDTIRRLNAGKQSPASKA